MTSCKPQGRDGQDNSRRAFPVKAALLRQGKTVTSLAMKLRWSRNAISRAIHHPALLPRLRLRIEKELGL